MRILFVASEVQPLVKTGGLADVAGALPAALVETGHDCRILLPAYPAVTKALGRARATATLQTRVGPVEIGEYRMPDTKVPVYTLIAPALYERPGGPYLNEQGQEHADSAIRFGLLSEVATMLCVGGLPGDWRPQILHLNDWQTGPAALWLRLKPVAGVRSVFSIHNIGYQGNFAPQSVDTLGLPWSVYTPDGAEFYGHFSFLKAGIVYSDAITTVSPTYAEEIQTADFGFGMDGMLRKRADALTGIVNGIDTRVWDPAGDPHVVRKYSAARLGYKQRNKELLQQALGLRPYLEAPLFGVVSRLAYQKGIDLLVQTLPALIEQGAQLAVLGSGDPELEQTLSSLATRFPDAVAVRLGYDEQLAHRIEAGADAFVMPSRYEPCGLNQMYSMRYGTLPIVRATGGLADTVTGLDVKRSNLETATGFSFGEATQKDLAGALRQAIAVWREPSVWRQMQRNAMQRDFSWRASAQRYSALYQDLLQRP
ncbi:MAG: glycogen synthase GlgA [Chromatiales bacterium]|nr:glycogen synthase GlgA [Chromatiales bacterium]